MSELNNVDRALEKAQTGFEQLQSLGCVKLVKSLGGPIELNSMKDHIARLEALELLKIENTKNHELSSETTVV